MCFSMANVILIFYTLSKKRGLQRENKRSIIKKVKESQTCLCAIIRQVYVDRIIFDATKVKRDTGKAGGVDCLRPVQLIIYN